jgi:IPT/TIG domain
MSRLSLWFLLALALIGAGCGAGSQNMGASGVGTALPTISELSPDNAHGGGMAFTLTVNGSGFGTDTVVCWGSAPQATMFLSNHQVVAQISAGDIMDPGMIAVYVVTGGKRSNSIDFQVE